VVAGPDLPGAVEEVARVGALHPAAARLLPPRSTVQSVLDAFGSSDLAHLACHGLLRGDNPLFSALLLSDGPLTVHELVTRSRAPRRVVLAACDSGAERQYDGNELLGFVSALMGRGAAGVVASTIPVPDGACTDLMARLHAELATGASMSAALHTARGQALAAGDTRSIEGHLTWCGFLSFGAA
jgi:CHAT domain-containing protein